MSDLQKNVEQASARLIACQQEREAAEKSAQAHEQAARQDRLAMSNLKREAEELRKVLFHAGVQQATEDASAAAKRAQAEAEKHNAEAKKVLDSLAAKEKALDAKLAELAKPKE